MRRFDHRYFPPAARWGLRDLLPVPDPAWVVTDGTPGLAAAHEGRMAMSAAELVSHLYRHRDERQRGSAGWVDLHFAILLLDRAWSRPGRMAAYELAEARQLVARWVPELADDVSSP